MSQLAVWSDQVRKTAGHPGLRHSDLAPEEDGHSPAPWYQAVIPKLGPLSLVGRCSSSTGPFCGAPPSLENIKRSYSPPIPTPVFISYAQMSTAETGWDKFFILLFIKSNIMEISTY